MKFHWGRFYFGLALIGMLIMEIAAFSEIVTHYSSGQGSGPWYILGIFIIAGFFIASAMNDW